jgi:hypothetical protein
MAESFTTFFREWSRPVRVGNARRLVWIEVHVLILSARKDTPPLLTGLPPIAVLRLVKMVRLSLADAEWRL